MREELLPMCPLNHISCGFKGQHTKIRGEPGDEASTVSNVTSVVACLLFPALHSQSLEERRSLISTSVSLRAVAAEPTPHTWCLGEREGGREGERGGGWEGEKEGWRGGC